LSVKVIVNRGRVLTRDSTHPCVDLPVDRAAARDDFIAIFEQLIADSVVNQSRHLGYASACEK
jgi:hypothetical protein